MKVHHDMFNFIAISPKVAAICVVTSVVTQGQRGRGCQPASYYDLQHPPPQICQSPEPKLRPGLMCQSTANAATVQR